MAVNAKVFGLAVVPAQPRENADVARELLVEAHARPVFERTGAAYGLNDGSGSGLLG